MKYRIAKIITVVFIDIFLIVYLSVLYMCNLKKCIYDTLQNK